MVRTVSDFRAGGYDRHPADVVTAMVDHVTRLVQTWPTETARRSLSRSRARRLAPTPAEGGATSRRPPARSPRRARGPARRPSHGTRRPARFDDHYRERPRAVHRAGCRRGEEPADAAWRRSGTFDCGPCPTSSSTPSRAAPARCVKSPSTSRSPASTPIRSEPWRGRSTPLTDRPRGRSRSGELCRADASIKPETIRQAVRVRR
jgi:hypothetical protein